MYLLRVISFFIVFTPIVSIGQNSKNDLTKLSYDEIKSFYFSDSKATKGKEIYLKAYLSKAKKENINYRIARGYYLYAYSNYDINNEKAIKFLDRTIFYSKIEPDTIFPAAAYREKADILVKENKFREAIKNYKEAERYALKNNIPYYHIVRDAIATTKSENLGEFSEALEIYRENFKYYSKKNFRNKKYSIDYINTIYGLADVYASLEKIDSCSYYNKLGYNEASITKNEEFKYRFVLNEGANQNLKRNYNNALDSINKALPKIILYKDIDNILASYYHRGRSYEGLKNKKLAAINYIKVDSMYNIIKSINPEFVDGYPFLISYFNDIGDKNNQLKYLTKYMKIDSILQKNYKELNKILNKEYDTPRLVKSKENIIEQLSSKNLSFLYIISFLILLFILSLYYLRRQNKLHKKRFEQIITEYSIKNNKENAKDTDHKEIIIHKNKEFEISDYLVLDILDKLKEFEISKNFLKQNLTIQSLSSEFNTNVKYLSHIVNNYKKKSFINYINDLRIDFAIDALQQDKKLQKYTLQALSKEFGFNNAQSFSTAFFKKAGLKITFFIKELENINNLKSIK